MDPHDVAGNARISSPGRLIRYRGFLGFSAAVLISGSLPALAAPVDPCFDTDPILAYQDVTLDALPVAIIYHPPGTGTFPDADTGHEEPVGQELTLTERFGTRTRLTEISYDGETQSVGLSASYKFITVHGESGQGAGQSDGSESGTWEIRMSATSWPSGFGDVSVAPPPFPASGDKIVYYLAPQFRVTYQVGHIHTDQECEPDHSPYHPDGSRDFRGMEPINLDQWSRRAATVWELRSGIGNGQQSPGQPLAPDLVEKLLALDPMTLADATSGAPARRSSLIGRDVLRGGAFPSPRFVFQDRYPWSSCDNAFQVTSSVEIGESSSTTTTYRYSGSVTYAGSVTIPIYGVEIEPAGSYGQTFGFEYSRNEMTEHASTTDAQAVLGGGSECPSTWYETSVWYDSAFGSFVFPTEELEANVRGRVQGGRSEVVVEGGRGISLHTRTDADGRFAFSLDPGQYSVQARSLGGPALSRRAVVDVTDGASVELDDLALGVDSDRAPVSEPAVVTPASGRPTIERDLERATPTSTPAAGPRTLDPGVRAPTPTATPERPGVRLPGSR